MDSKSLFLTANCDTVYFWTYLDLSKGLMVVEAPANALVLSREDARDVWNYERAKAQAEWEGKALWIE